MESSITVRVWNAGFIRQWGEPCVRLPDESGVPVLVSGCARLEPGKNGRINSDVVFAPLASAASWLLQLAQSVAQ
jgi:hypothetical protein